MPVEHGVYPQLVDRKTAAKILDIKESTLADWAVKGIGPVMVKIGRLVKYNIDDLTNWLKSREASSTAKYGRGF